MIRRDGETSPRWQRRPNVGHPAAAAGESPFRDILAAVRTFCAGRSLGDDCTVFELTYKG